jgi:hypothetical protein
MAQLLTANTGYWTSIKGQFFFQKSGNNYYFPHLNKVFKGLAEINI